MQRTHHAFFMTMKCVLAPAVFMLLSSPVSAHAQGIHFIQHAAYCSTAVGHLQGQLSFFNPSSTAITLEVTGNLHYSLSGGTPLQESRTTTFTIGPWQTSYYQLANTQPAYGCHGVMRFFGTIRMTGQNTSSTVLAGNVLTSMPNSNSIIQYVNVPFAIPNPTPKY
ncbi:hypothetical protein [Archangium violaceum]|uniref:hypothetical protein n=1 Tax=Archangium violaceum TaxID=83451 RepID=UPI00126A4666|nr:hypothetical protein [Archangium violaceum]